MQSLKIKVDLGWRFPVTHFWMYDCLWETGVEETQATIC